jgi:signal transduction histidine kinase
MSRSLDFHLQWRSYLLRRGWLLGGLLMMLCALAAVEYYWIEEVIRAQRQRALALLDASLISLKREFDFEVTRSFAIFTLGTTGSEPYALRYAEWQRHARYPRLLLGVYILDTGEARALLKPIMPQEPMPAEAAWKADLAGLTAQLEAAATPTCSGPPTPAALSFLRTWPGQPHIAGPGAALAYRQAGSSFRLPGDGPIIAFGANAFSAQPAIWGLTVAGNPAFAFLLNQSPPGRIRSLEMVQDSHPVLAGVCGLAAKGQAVASAASQPWALAIFDVNYLATTLLPELLRHHLPGSYALDYQIQLIERGARSADRILFPAGKAAQGAGSFHPDRQIDLFSLRPSCFLPALPRAADELPVPGVVSLGELLARKPSSCDADNLPHLAGAPGRWMLQVDFRPQSGERAMATFQRRSVLISCGVLLVLGVGMLALVVLSERASALAEMRTELLLGISHELRTPLTVIRVAASNLREGIAASSEQVANYGQIIDQEACRLSDMVEDSLAFARLRSSRRALDTAPVPVEPLLRSSLVGFERALSDAGFEVQIRIEPELPPLLVNGRLIGKCLENLVQNAIKYAASGRFIALSAQRVERQEGPRVLICVADRGPGINAAELPLIFEPFYRGRNATAVSAAGIGLGLTFVKRVMEAHRGGIEVGVSEVGTVFSLFLPCQRTPARAPGSSQP